MHAPATQELNVATITTIKNVDKVDGFDWLCEALEVSVCSTKTSTIWNSQNIILKKEHASSMSMLIALYRSGSTIHFLTGSS